MDFFVGLVVVVFVDLSPLILLFFLFSFFSCLFISFLPVHVAKTESVDVIYTLRGGGGEGGVEGRGGRIVV